MIIRDLGHSDTEGGHYVGHLAAPDGPDGRAVLLAHNAPGVDTFEREVAQRLAGLGYVVFCADDVGEGQVLSMDEMHARPGPVMADNSLLRAPISAGLRALVAQPGVDAARVAAIGYCLGGLAVLELGRSGADVAAVVAFHATLPVARPEDNRAVRGKVLVQTGTADAMTPADVRAAFGGRWTGVDWRMILYGGIQHAFTVPGASGDGIPGLRYDARADARSWRAMLDLFGETIG